jgi:hypothetical protein
MELGGRRPTGNRDRGVRKNPPERASGASEAGRGTIFFLRKTPAKEAKMAAVRTFLKKTIAGGGLTR